MMLALAFTLFCLGIATASLPSGVKMCPVSTSNYNDCMKKKLQQLWPHLMNGESSNKLPSLDPLLWNRASVHKKGSYITVNADFSKIQLTGGRQATIKRVQIDPRKLNFKIELKVPNLAFRGSYVTQSSLGFIPVNGNGICIAKFDDVDMTIEFNGQKYNDNGVSRLSPKNVKISSYAHNGHFRFETPQKFLAGMVQKYFDSDMRGTLDLIQPSMDENLEIVSMEILKSVLATLTFDELFPK